MFELYVTDLYAPGVGSFVQNTLDLAVELFAFGEHLIKVVLPEDRTKRGLGELTGCHFELLDLDDRLLRIQNAKINNRIDLDRHVVFGDDVLGRHVEGAGTQVHAHHLLNEGDDNDEVRPFHLPEPAQQKHDPAFVQGNSSRAANTVDCSLPSPAKGKRAIARSAGSSRSQKRRAE